MDAYQKETDRINTLFPITDKMTRQQVVAQEEKRTEALKELNSKRGLKFQGGFLQ